MDLTWDKVSPYTTPLIGFTGQTIKSDGKISLPVFFGDTAHMVEFLIVSAPSPSIKSITGKGFYLWFIIEVPNNTDVHMIYGDKKAAQECYFAIVKEVDRVE